MADRKGMTRRELFARTAGAATAASLGGLASCFPDVGGKWPVDPDAGICSCPDDGGTGLQQTTQDDTGPRPGRSAVVTIQRSDSTDATGHSTAQPQLGVVQAMVDATLTALAGGASNPWPVLIPGISACTRIGLKINCLNSAFGTSPAIVRALINNLVTNLQTCPTNIIVWDRNLDEMQKVGYEKAADFGGVRLLGTYQTPTGQGNGPGYRDTDYEIQGTSPKLSRILTDLTDVTINCPVLKVHGQTGITAAIKNVFGIIDCPGTFHTDAVKGHDIQTALPHIYNFREIRQSIQLTIVDALRAVTNGDTSSLTNATPGRIIASTDPLALDYYALDLINQLRAAPPLRLPAVTTPLDWMDNAYQLGLGTKGYTLTTLQADGQPASSDGGIDGSGGGDAPRAVDAAL